MQTIVQERNPTMYRLHFCDRSTCPGASCPCYQHCSPISPNALELVVREMPTLKSILYGHPSMMPHGNARQQDHLGICHLYLHADFQVVREDFEILVRCLKAIPEVQPPALTNLMAVAILVAEKFGGCPALDDYQRRLDAFHTMDERIAHNPSHPVQDVDSLYDWKTMGPIPSTIPSPRDAQSLQEWQNQGFEVAQFCTPAANADIHYLILRRRKALRNMLGREAADSPMA